MKKRSQALKNLTQRAKALTQKDWYEVLLNERVDYTKNGQKITLPKICRTRNYEMLQYFMTNRNTTLSHIRTMGKSVTELSYITRQIVVVNVGKEYLVADAQHLLKWLISEEMAVEFLMIELKDISQGIDVMRVLNSSARRWGLNQFINVNTSTNIHEAEKNPYNKLQKYVADNKVTLEMTPMVMAALMNSETRYNEGAASSLIKKGCFTQQVSDSKINKMLAALRRFYKKTKMTPTNYLNGAFFYLLYDKNDVYYKNQDKFIAEVSKYVTRHKLTNLKFGNKKDASTLLERCWINM